MRSASRPRWPRSSTEAIRTTQSPASSSPTPASFVRDAAETDDPIGDDAKSPVKGLVHRYPDRVLIKLVAVCAVYCRFCFRRERIGPGSGSLSEAEFEAALDYLRARPELGGHPDRRRPLDPVAAPCGGGDAKNRGGRSRQDSALAQPLAGGGARARDGGARARASSRRQDCRRRRPRQSSARTRRGRPRGLPAARVLRRHAGQPERAARGASTTTPTRWRR